jgi:hypothetical protein
MKDLTITSDLPEDQNPYLNNLVDEITKTIKDIEKDMKKMNQIDRKNISAIVHLTLVVLLKAAYVAALTVEIANTVGFMIDELCTIPKDDDLKLIELV